MDGFCPFGGHQRGQSSRLMSPIQEISVGQNNFEFHPQHKKLAEEIFTVGTLNRL